MNCEITDPAGHPVIVMRQGEPEDRSDGGSASRRVDFSVLIRVACRKRIAFTGRSECRGARHRSVLAFVSVATPISRAAGALTWLTNLLGNRTRGKSSPPRKRRRRRRPRKSRRRRQRPRNRSVSKAEAVGNRIYTNLGGPHTEQAIVGRVSELRTGDGAPPSSDEPFHRGRQVVRGARYLGDLSFVNILFVINAWGRDGSRACGCRSAARGSTSRQPVAMAATFG